MDELGGGVRADGAADVRVATAPRCRRRWGRRAGSWSGWGRRFGAGVRQGLPLERDDEAPGGARSAELRERAEPGSSELEAGPGRAEAHLRQPAPDPRRSWQAPAEGAGREAGARLRPHARHRRHAPDAPARAREHPRADAGARDRVQMRHRSSGSGTPSGRHASTSNWMPPLPALLIARFRPGDVGQLVRPLEECHPVRGARAALPEAATARGPTGQVPRSNRRWDAAAWTLPSPPIRTSPRAVRIPEEFAEPLRQRSR